MNGIFLEYDKQFRMYVVDRTIKIIDFYFQNDEMLILKKSFKFHLLFIAKLN